jgi:hypothetical protein
MKRTLSSITLLIWLALLPFSGCASTRDRLRESWNAAHTNNNNGPLLNSNASVPYSLQGLSYASMNDWNFRK